MTFDPKTFKAPQKPVINDNLLIENQSITNNSTVFSLDKAEPLEPESFPNKPRAGSTSIPATIPNVEHLLSAYHISARYNVITKKILINIPGLSGTTDNADNVAMSHILSLANLNGLATGMIPDFVSTIADKHQTNPVSNWIKSQPWDGVNRLNHLIDTLETRENFPTDFKETLIHKWLIGAVAGAMIISGV